jgi:hypothetical protein
MENYLTSNVFSGEYYRLASNNQLVKYVGFIPNSGHWVIFNLDPEPKEVCVGFLEKFRMIDNVDRTYIKV